MKEFPNHLRPVNKDRFPKYCYDRNLAYLRKEVFELILLGDENSYFELDNFARKYRLKKGEIEQMRDIIMKELVQLGWNVKTSFGGTGLFVYSTSTLPHSCYEDEF